MTLIISNTLKSQFYKILWITVGWTFISVYYVFIVYAQLIKLDLYTSDVDLWLHIKGSFMTGIFAGITGGSLLVFFGKNGCGLKNTDRVCGVFCGHIL